MPFRLIVAALLALVSVQALAFDPTKASRYASPDLYRPNVDQIIINGPGSKGPIDDMSLVSPATGLANKLSMVINSLEISLPQCKLPADPDWTLAFQRCQATGRKVYVPPGSYTVGTGGISAKILSDGQIRGAGQALVEVKLADGANTDVFATPNVYSLYGNDYGTGSDRWSVSGITIDGNRSKQTASGSAIDRVNGLSIYGVGFNLHDVTINNVLGHGIRSEWQRYGEPINALETRVQNVTIDTTGRHGWWNNGPHDSHLDTVIIIDASQEADNTYDGVYMGEKGNGRWNDFHNWHRSTSTKRVAWNFSSYGSNQITASHFEGGRGWIQHRGPRDVITASLFYAPYNYANTAGVQFCDVQNIHTGNTYVGPGGTPNANPAPYNGTPMTAFQIGCNGSGGYGNMITNNIVVGFGNKAVTFIGAPAMNTIEISGGDNGTGKPYNGTPSSTDRITYRDPSTGLMALGAMNVAIGGSRASQMLDLNGGYINLDYGRGIRVGSNTAPTSEGGDNTWSTGTSKLIDTGFYNNTDTVRLYTPGAQSSAPRMTFQANGNNGIGLGTGAAGAAWDVAGTMRGQMLTLSAAPTTTNVPTSYWTVVKRTDDGSVKICANDNGTVKCGAAFQ